MQNLPHPTICSLLQILKLDEQKITTDHTPHDHLFKSRIVAQNLSDKDNGWVLMGLGCIQYAIFWKFWKMLKPKLGKTWLEVMPIGKTFSSCLSFSHFCTSPRWSQTLIPNHTNNLLHSKSWLTTSSAPSHLFTHYGQKEENFSRRTSNWQFLWKPSTKIPWSAHITLSRALNDYQFKFISMFGGLELKLVSPNRQKLMKVKLAMIFNTTNLIVSLIIKNITMAMTIMTIISTSIMGEASLGGTKVHPAVQLATATSTSTMSRCIPATSISCKYA